MSRALRHYENDTRFIAAHHQPAVLIDFARSRDIDMHHLLRGTGLFYEDILTGRMALSPQQFLHLIANTEYCLKADDTSFLLGERLFPGHYGTVSHALMQAANLGEALTMLLRFQSLLCPLLAPRLLREKKYSGLYWVDACGVGTQQAFLVEMQMTAVAALCRWLSGERLPWAFHFSHAAPAWREQYLVHLGSDLHFDARMDAMLIDNNCLQRPWPRGSATAARVLQTEGERELAAQGYSSSLLLALYDYLLEHVQAAPSLEQTAQAFAMSPATLKRHLQKHDSSFQAQLDLVRKHVALYLLRLKGWDNEAVARHLQFHDANNFRRSFKRWTGLTPQALRKPVLVG